MMQRARSRTQGTQGAPGVEPSRQGGIGFRLTARCIRGFGGALGGKRHRHAAATMSELGRELAEIGVRLIDDAYMVWFAAARESEQALAGWRDGTVGVDSAAYASYRAALDREEAAARDLQRLSALASPCRERLAISERLAVPGAGGLSKTSLSTGA